MPQKTFVNSSHPKKYLPNFVTQKCSGIENFNPPPPPQKKILLSSPSLEIPEYPFPHPPLRGGGGGAADKGLKL